MTTAAASGERVRTDLVLVVAGGQDALPRVVRIVSSGSSEIVRLRVGPTRTGRRRVRMLVETAPESAATLQRRLDRAIDVVSVHVVRGPASGRSRDASDDPHGAV